ncbi:MAG: phytanoyl-CoA dioxygenase family protein [Acidimicrobiales bacterium]
MTAQFSPQDAERSGRWGADGYVALPELLDPADVAELASWLHALFGRYDDLPEDQTHTLVRADGRAGSLEIRLTTELDPRIAASPVFAACRDVASHLLGRPAKFFFDHAIRKPAEVGAGTAWHQDRAYNLDEPQRERVHFWIPMHDVDLDGGCMQFIPSSTAWGLLPHHPIEADPARHTLEAEGDYDPDAVAVPLRLGDVSAHHPLVLHKTGPNISKVERTALILQFVRPRTFREHLAAHLRRPHAG